MEGSVNRWGWGVEAGAAAVVRGKPGALPGLLQKNPVERSASLMLLVRPDLSGKGLSRPMGKWLLPQIVGEGKAFSILRACCNNKGSENLLRKIGFAPVEWPGVLMEFRHE